MAMPSAGASIFADGRFWSLCMCAQQNTFFLYHRNSYANNPAMLRSPKPLVMRDFFLTRAGAPVANPASAYYVPFFGDMCVNCVSSWLYGVTLVPLIGGLQLTGIFVLGGWFGGNSWLFQAAVNPNRLNSKFDVNACSNAAWSAAGAAALFVPNLKIPFTRIPLAAYTVPVTLRALYYEYVDPKIDPPPKNVAQITNGGNIAGIFFGLMYGALVLRTRADKSLASRFFQNVRSQPPRSRR